MTLPLQTAASQMVLAQSEPTRHASPSGQSGHEPPQSTPVSLPLATLSLHCAAWHTPAAQLPLAQSEAKAQLFPSAQGEQVPPQSTSVSFPSFI